jgi:copper chaperone CopZ
MIIHSISGLTCENCVAKASHLLTALSPQIKVQLQPPQVFAPKDISLTALNAALDGTKYKIGPLEVKESLFPLFLILGLIALVSLKDAFNFHGWMMSYMAGFFIVFGAFKLLNLQGFADAYQTYDIIAKRSRAYALAYPFLEIILGFAFLYHYEMRLITWASLILMGIGTIGVANALLKKQRIKCACLGTTLNLPMTTVTLIENLSMVAMSVWMLV